MFRGILFDFDGTLADTMESHCLAWKKALAERGIYIQASDYYPLEGMRLHEIAVKLISGFHVSEEVVESLVRRKKELYLERQEVRFYPGVESLVRELKMRRVPIGIVTASYLDQLKFSVPDEFLREFNAIVTGDQVLHGKPDPESYLLGARALGLLPQECVSIENAPLGVQSARKAGTYCVGVCSTVVPEQLLEANEVVAAFEDLKSVRVVEELLSSDL